MTDVLISRYGNGFSVYSRHTLVVNALYSLNESLTLLPMNRQGQYSNFKKPLIEKKDEYFIHSNSEDAYYYSNALYETVMNIIGRLINPTTRTSYKVEETKHVQQMGECVVYDRHTLQLVEDESSPFKFQNEIIDFAMQKDTHHRIFEVQTGRGKTKMSLKVAVRYGQRLLIITKASYVPKWKNDVIENLNLRPGELVIPSSRRKFEDLLDIGQAGRMGAMDKNDSTVKVIILSSSILDGWINEWVSLGHPIHPTTIASVLGVGMILYDESHQFFRKNYWSFILLNASKFLDLSATLEPDDTDRFMIERYEERFPKGDRYAGLEYNKYIDAYSLYYGIKDRKMRGRINKMKMYNHTEFEARIMADKDCLSGYFGMISDIVDNWYLKRKEKGEKCLVFFATKKMCTLYKEHAEKRFKDLKVTRNIEGDDYDEFLTGDLCVSTPGKSGTAVDIPGLILSIVSVAISKRQMNLQILGRTRDLRKPDKYPKVVFLHCANIRKHIEYLNKRKRIFEGKVQKFIILNSPFTI